MFTSQFLRASTLVVVVVVVVLATSSEKDRSTAREFGSSQKEPGVGSTTKILFLDGVLLILLILLIPVAVAVKGPPLEPLFRFPFCVPLNVDPVPTLTPRFKLPATSVRAKKKQSVEHVVTPKHKANVTLSKGAQKWRPFFRRRQPPTARFLYLYL